VSSQPPRPDGRPAVLMLRALGLGDFLAGVPAYRALAAGSPGCEIVLAAPAVLAPLAALTGAIDRVLPAGELDPVSWSGPPPAVAADLHGSGPASHRIVTALGATEATMMFRSPSAPDVAGPDWDDEEHEVTRWCRLAEWWGLAADPRALALARPPERPAAPGAVVLHPGAASGSRRWPARRFAAVAQAMSAAGHPVVITGTGAERPLAREIASLAGLPPRCVLAGRTGLAGLAAQVAGAALVISNDTGVAHLAVAFGTPSVTLFGPVSPRLWGPPPGSGRHVALWKGSGGRPGDAHGAEPDPRLLRIRAADVLSAAGTLLAGPPADPPPARTAPSRQPM
jgi:ADP-heptose:LPS heptosyltransferase